MRIKKRNRIADGCYLHRIGLIASARIPLHIDEAVNIVLVGCPLGVLAGLDQKIIADPENALQLIAVATVNEDRRRDGA